MRYDRESWRKLYREEPFEQRAWPLMARGIRDYLIRAPGDDDGTLIGRTTDPISDLTRLLGPSADEENACREAVQILLTDGYLRHDKRSGRLWIRRFCEAQTARSKAAERKAKQREREREAAAASGRDSHNPCPVPCPDSVTGTVPPIEETRRDEKRRDPPNPQPGEPATADARRVFEDWKNDTGHHRAKFDTKRKRRILARLREGFTADELTDAITNRRLDPFLLGENKTGMVYDGIDTLLRDAAQVERLLGLSGRFKGGSTPDPAEAAKRDAERVQRETDEMAAQQAKAAQWAPQGAERPNVRGLF